MIGSEGGLLPLECGVAVPGTCSWHREIMALPCMSWTSEKRNLFEVVGCSAWGNYGISRG